MTAAWRLSGLRALLLSFVLLYPEASGGYPLRWLAGSSCRAHLAWCSGCEGCLSILGRPRRGWRAPRERLCCQNRGTATSRRSVLDTARHCRSPDVSLIRADHDATFIPPRRDRQQRRRCESCNRCLVFFPCHRPPSERAALRSQGAARLASSREGRSRVSSMRCSAARGRLGSGFVMRCPTRGTPQFHRFAILAISKARVRFGRHGSTAYAGLRGAIHHSPFCHHCVTKLRGRRGTPRIRSHGRWKVAATHCRRRDARSPVRRVRPQRRVRAREIHCPLRPVSMSFSLPSADVRAGRIDELRSHRRGRAHRMDFEPPSSPKRVLLLGRAQKGNTAEAASWAVVSTRFVGHCYI